MLVDEKTLPAKPTHSGNLDNLMLVTEREGRGIAVIDGDTHTLLGKVDASYRAHGYTFDPTSDRWAYNVGRDGWLFKIDLYTLKPVRKVKVGLDSRGIAMSDDGRYRDYRQLRAGHRGDPGRQDARAAEGHPD